MVSHHESHLHNQFEICYYRFTKQGLGILKGESGMLADTDAVDESQLLVAACQLHPENSVMFQNLLQKYRYMLRGIVGKYRGVLDETVLEELTLEAELALWHAAQDYDSQKGVPFGAFASFTVNTTLIDYMREAHPKSMIRISRASQRAAQESGSDPEVTVVSLDGNDAEDSSHFLEETFLSDENRGDPAQLLFLLGGRGPTREKLAEAIASLSERLRRVVDLYFFEGLILREIALLLKISEGRACQLKGDALRQLRRALSDDIAPATDAIGREEKGQQDSRIATQSHHRRRQRPRTSDTNKVAGRSNGMDTRTVTPGLLPVASVDGGADAVRLTPGIFRIATQMYLRLPVKGRAQPDRDEIAKVAGTTTGGLQISIDQLVKLHVIDRPMRGWYARGAQALVYCREGKNRDERGEVSLVPKDPTGFRFQTERYYDLGETVQLLPSLNGRSHSEGQPTPSLQPPKSVVRVETPPPILQLPAPIAEPNGFANLDKGIADREGWLAEMASYLERLPDARVTLIQLEEQIRAGMERQRGHLVTLNAARKIRDGNTETSQPAEAT